MDDFRDRLGRTKQGVEGRLKVFLDVRAREAEGLSPVAGQLMRVLTDFTLRGGKRLRAALVFAGHACLSDREEESLWDVAMAVELIQSFLLVHDDVIDQDDARRGSWTVHRWYRDWYRDRFDRGNPAHFGDSMAILCGDAALLLANELVGDSALEATVRAELLSAMNRMVRQVVYGEAMDVLSPLGEEVGEEEILLTYTLKTAAYTVEGPLHMGAIVAGGQVADLERLSGFAVPLGQAFQLQDDILGLFGNAGTTGKPVGSDIREGKRTFLVERALRSADAEQRAFLLEALGNPALTEQAVRRVREIVTRTGAEREARERAGKLVDVARKALAVSGWRQAGVRFLEGALDYIVSRES